MPILRFVAVGLAKTLSKLFGLATVTLFGRLPSRDDEKIALVGLLSLAWLPVLVAVAVPGAAKLIVPFAPDDDAAARILAVTLALLIPLVAGAVVGLLHNNRGNGWRRGLAHTVSGFVYVPVIGAVVVAIVVVVPILKASYLARRFSVHRLMLMVPASSYRELVDHLVDVLGDAGIDVEVARSNRVIEALFRALAFILGRVFDRDVAKEMCVLRRSGDGEWFEVTVHAADLTIVGREDVAARVQAALADGIDERLVYLTWDDASQELEDRIRAFRERLDAGEEIDAPATAALAEDLAQLSLGREEWDAVRRLVYRLERDAAQRRAARLEQEVAASESRRGRQHA